MKTITVDRKKWARGGKNGDACLLNDQGNMCCLGFAARQISRISRSALADAGMPCDVYMKPSFLTEIDTSSNPNEVQDNALSRAAANFNDDLKISDKMREYKLTRLFKKHGIKIRFVN
jgi:hypothetical protein